MITNNGLPTKPIVVIGTYHCVLWDRSGEVMTVDKPVYDAFKIKFDMLQKWLAEIQNNLKDMEKWK